MASPKLRIGRVSLDRHYYAMTFVVVNRRRIFANPDWATRLATELMPDAVGMRFQPLAWTIMPDHVHLLAELGAVSLARCMQVLKSRTSRELRAVQAHSGTLWQAGYYDHCLRNDEDLLGQARYILENPVRAGIVDRSEEYPFSWSVWGRTP
jgi:REP element-mobilizing transposase RayT